MPIDLFNEAGRSGFSGYSGVSGFSGISGFSGFSGISGFSGYSGISGYSGVSGFSGYSGRSGFSGYSGPTGASGFSGYSGATGSGGSPGSAGVSGFSGYSGSKGDTGASGFSGYSGPSGFSGYSGPSGFSGYSGPSGFSGYSGISGFSGYSGRSGFSGYSGPKGDTGSGGATGSSGFSGYSGPSGFSGYSGISGFSGYSGKSGYSGYSGAGNSGFSGYSGGGGSTWSEANLSMTGDTNDATTSGATHLRVSANAGTYKLTGAAAGANGSALWIDNVGSNPFRIMHEDVNSNAVNRFQLPDQLPWLPLRPGTSMSFLYDDTNDRWVYQFGLEEIKSDPNYYACFFDDFNGGSQSTTQTVGELGWALSGTGTKSNAPYESGHYGTRYCRTTAAATDSFMVLGGNNPATSMDGFRADKELFVIEFFVKVPTLASSGTQEFSCEFGLGDKVGGVNTVFIGGANSGLAFIYDIINSPNWRCYTASIDNGAGTLTTTGIVVDTNWHYFKIVWDVPGGTGKYYIDGVNVAGHTSNLPDNVADIFNLLFFGTTRTTGSATRDVYIDWARCQIFRYAPLVTITTTGGTETL